VEIVFVAIIFALIISALAALVFAIRAKVPAFVQILILVLALAEAAIWFGVDQFPLRLRTALRTNIADTSTSSVFPELRTRFYSAPPDRVIAALTELVATNPSKWTLISSDPANGEAHLTVKVLNFTDDVLVHARPEAGRTRVDVHSNSRVGKGDFGENRRHVAWVLDGLDRTLR
jgi:uncharacterized protein (DUF1499 family)